VATGVPSAMSVKGPISGFPGWFVVPYLIFAIFQLFSINTLDLYSSGVTLQSLVPRLKRLHYTVICGALAADAVFSARFFTLLTDFILFIILCLGPWCAIYLIDSFLRRNRFHLTRCSTSAAVATSGTVPSTGRRSSPRCSEWPSPHSG
jgi:nucleobase:cation symporter-1, NCS1 family